MHSERRHFVHLCGGAARWVNPSLLSAIAGVTVSVTVIDLTEMEVFRIVGGVVANVLLIQGTQTHSFIPTNLERYLGLGRVFFVCSSPSM